MELNNVEIIRIGEIKKFDNSEFYLVEWHVKTDEQYPQFLSLQSNKEKADNLIKYNKVGDKVNVSINLRGREWTNPQGETKVFNTIEAWKVTKVNDTSNVQQTAQAVNNAIPAEDDNLPF